MFSGDEAMASNGVGNGLGHASNDNGAMAGPSSGRGFYPIYPGSQIDQQELVRLTLQCLQDAGYPDAAAALSKESGYTLESPTITTFRNGVLDGNWETVTRLLRDEHIIEGDVLGTVKFLIAEQKFMEHLEARETKKALSVLRNELAPLNHNQERLHQLSSFMMCAGPSELRERSGWLGTGALSRLQLLDALQTHIPASVMIPQRRLETLLEQAKEQQRTQCRYHAVDTPISLYSDHVCDRSVFPTVTTHILHGHADEVWRVEFSHDGRYLATAGADGSVMVWKAKEHFTVLHELHAADATEKITSIAWSPDDSMLLLGVECAVKVFDVQSGLCRLNVTKHEFCAVGGVAWMTNSKGFFSGGLDARVLCWDLEGNISYAFSTSPYRIVDVAASPDGARLVCIGEASHVPRISTLNGALDGPSASTPGKGMFEVLERRLIIFNLAERRQERSLHHPTSLTCVTFAPDDPRHVLVNQSPDEVVLYDIVDGSVHKRYRGHQQGMYMVRSCFGGASKSFVISGSEDAMIYVWHKDNIEPLEILAGHDGGTVNDVAWNPSSAGMFASAGDDKTVRIWQAPSAATP